MLSDAKFRAEAASGKHYTVADAVADYIEYLSTHRKSADDAAIKLNAYGVPILGEKRVSELTPADFDEWLTTALKRQQRRKPKKPRPEPKRQRKKKAASAEANESGRATPADPDEQRRRRKSTLNRVITALKAALNHAHDRQKVASRDPWAKLKKLRASMPLACAGSRRREAKRLMDAASADMRKLIQGGLMTGCRAGELARARARDFDSTPETLLVPDSKTGKPRRVRSPPRA